MSFELVPCNEIEWIDGVPHPPVHKKPITKSVLASLQGAVLALDYTPNPEIDGDHIYAGKTNAEVMILKLAKSAASGDTTAFKEFMDRYIGKPKQSVETVSVELTYQDFLDNLAHEQDKDNANRQSDIDAIYAEVIDPLEGL